MNKKIKIAVIFFIVSFIIFIGAIVSIERNKPIKIPYTNIELPIKQTERTASDYCEGLSESDCFSTLSECFEAESLAEFLEKKNIWAEDSPEDFTGKATPPIEMNFANAEIFMYTQRLGGGDSASFSFIKLDNKYCGLQENLGKIFKPIKSKEEALEYYLFIKKQLGNAYDHTQYYIMEESDYDDEDIILEMRWCDGENYRKKMKDRITEITKTGDGYLIDFIGFNYMYEVEFYELEVEVKYDGTIEEKSRKILIDCGQGAVF